MLFAVSILFHISPVEHPQSHFLWEERIVLLSGDDEDEVKEKAEILGHDSEHEYENANGQMVAHRFECVAAICAIPGEVTDGCEVFSRFLRDSEARSILTPFDD